MKTLSILSLWLASCILSLGAGAINGVTYSAWNGVEISSWNGSGVSAAGGGGGGGSDPDSIASLAMWLKADSIALADGADLNGVTWQDCHTTNKDASLYGASISYETAELNSLPCVRFTSAGQGSTALSLTAPYTIFLVEKSATNSGNRTISSLENNCLVSNGRDTIQGFVGGIVASGSQNTAACYSTLTVPASGNCTFRQNGVDETTGSIGFADWGTVYLGGGFNSEYPVSDVFEIIIYSAALNSTDRDAVEAYIATRYGL